MWTHGNGYKHACKRPTVECYQRVHRYTGHGGTSQGKRERERGGAATGKGERSGRDGGPESLPNDCVFRDISPAGHNAEILILGKRRVRKFWISPTPSYIFVPIRRPGAQANQSRPNGLVIVCGVPPPRANRKATHLTTYERRKWCTHQWNTTLQQQRADQHRKTRKRGRNTEWFKQPCSLPQAPPAWLRKQVRTRSPGMEKRHIHCWGRSGCEKSWKQRSWH